MYKFLVFIFMLCLSSVYGQNIVNRVRVRNNAQYMINIIQEVIKTIEEKGWWNLKLPDIHQNINETVLTQLQTGTVTYKNGFLVGVQGVDVLSSSLNQVWSVVAAEGTTQVQIRGQLRMTDVSLGYDIEAHLNGQEHHYTGVITQPMLTFDFQITRNVNRDELTDMTVTANQQTLAARRMDIRPLDRTAGALMTLFDRTSTLEGIRTWPDIFQPIALDVINNRIEFPGLCYNCAT